MSYDDGIRVSMRGPAAHKSQTFGTPETRRILKMVSNGWLPGTLPGMPVIITAPPLIAAHLARALRNRGAPVIAVRDLNGLPVIVRSTNRDYPLWHFLRQHGGKWVASEYPISLLPADMNAFKGCFRISDPDPAVAAYLACRLFDHEKVEYLKWMSARDTERRSDTYARDIVIASNDPEIPIGTLARKIQDSSINGWLASLPEPMRRNI